MPQVEKSRNDKVKVTRRDQVKVTHPITTAVYTQLLLVYPGASIDVQLHVDLFPKDGGALTTGGNSTYVKGTDSIVLGAEAILPRTLAHEFGHVLGFSDQYFRGYRDLGVEGYEIVEITPYPKDIMSSSGYGEANRFHFETIIEAAAKGKAKSKIAVE